MRHLFALALVAVGCGAAPPPLSVRPAAVAVAPEVAVATARSVIDARYGVDPNVGTHDVIVGNAEWLNDTAWLAHKWERGVIIHPMSIDSWFRVIAVVEYPRPGEVAVRVIGVAANGDQRFDGLEEYITSGDPRMPRWADVRVAVLQTVINKKLRALR